MVTRQGGSGARNALVLLILFIAGSVIICVATRSRTRRDQDGAPGELTPSPARRLERTAPLRNPIVLERNETAEGFVEAIIHLPPEADTYVASALPDQSFGLDPLYVGYSQREGFGAQRMLLRFDILNNVPQGAVVNNAILRLHANHASPTDDAPMNVVIRQLLSPWAETTVTWADQPTWGPVRAETGVGSALIWYEWDVTELVQDWESRYQENHGIQVIGDERLQQRERAFYARETDTLLYPRLIVDYTDYNDETPPTTRVTPLPDYVIPEFTVEWAGQDYGGSGIVSYDVQYRVDGGQWIDWLTDVTYESAEFTGGENGHTYAFRVRGEDRAGNVERSEAVEAATTVDSEPPLSEVDALPPVMSERIFRVSWAGHDHGSGIWYYDVRYRLDGSDWLPWQQETLATSGSFVAMLDGTYEFEVRAVDRLGLEEPFSGLPEASTTVDVGTPFGQP